MKKFRTLYGKEIPDVLEYVKDYLSRNENIDILIGCDSQNHSLKTVYGVVLVLYTRGKGGHVLCYKETTPRERVNPVRLMNEVWKSVELAEYLRENGIPRAKFIDIDLNPDPKYKSNEVLRQAVGLVEGMGYTARYKHGGVQATCSANYLVRN